MPDQLQMRQIGEILGNVGLVGGHLWALLNSDALTEVGAISAAVAKFARMTTEVDPPLELAGRVWAEIDGAVENA